MAANIPAGLKSADISRFALRASQVEKVKPVIAYWCNYHIVNQILSKGLHTTDAESTTYTTNMMDRLEAVKAAHPDEDAIVDDVAAQAYVEQFGLDTFQRADNAVKANKVTRQTADTFQAAATFLDLAHIWGAPEGEIAAKIKYAKFHALRIAKAIKAGEDPNLSNPAPEEAPTEEAALDPDDPEVQILDSAPAGASNDQRPRQASVEEIPDEHDKIERRLAARSNLDESLHPSRASSVPRPQPAQAANPHVPSPLTHPMNGAPSADDVSPLQPSPAAPSASAGEGYFPNVPTFTSETGTSRMPTAPPDAPSLPPSDPGFSSLPQPPTAPGNFGMPPPSAPQDPGSGHAPRSRMPPQQPSPPPQDFYYGQSAAQPTAPPPPVRSRVAPPAALPAANEGLQVDEEAMAMAQKHARWAISALNFEDVKTAVTELRGALESLGAR